MMETISPLSQRSNKGKGKADDHMQDTSSLVKMRYLFAHFSFKRMARTEMVQSFGDISSDRRLID